MNGELSNWFINNAASWDTTTATSTLGAAFDQAKFEREIQGEFIEALERETSNALHGRAINKPTIKERYKDNTNVGVWK